MRTAIATTSVFLAIAGALVIQAVFNSTTATWFVLLVVLVFMLWRIRDWLPFAWSSD